MKDYIGYHGARHNIIDVVVIVGILLFSLLDFRLFLRIILENDYLANGIWMFSNGLMIFLSMLYLLHYRFPYYIHMFLLAGILGISVKFFKGAPFTTLLTMTVSYMIVLLFYISILKKRIHLEVVTKIILIFSIIHIVAVIGGESFFKAGLDRYSVYGASSVLLDRSIGFMRAPGVLSFFAVFVTVYSIVVYRLTSNKIALILVFFGFSLGIFSGNRSFLIAISLMLILMLTLNYQKKPLNKLYELLKYSIFLSILIGFVVYYYGDLFSQILSRFNEAYLLESYYTRVEGEAGFIPNLYALMDNPILGPWVYTEKGPHTIYNGEKITSSNGMLSIFVSNGLILGSVYFSFYVRGFYLLWRSTRGKYIHSDLFVLNKALLYCYIGLTIVTIFDSLLESAIMKLIIVYANMPRIRQNSHNCLPKIQ